MNPKIFNSAIFPGGEDSTPDLLSSIQAVLLHMDGFFPVKGMEELPISFFSSLQTGSSYLFGGSAQSHETIPLRRSNSVTL
jgi:hypothetical protein